MFGDSLIPFFILIFLILSCIIYLLFKKRETDTETETRSKRPPYSIPTKPEGFQNTNSGSPAPSISASNLGSSPGYYPGGSPYGFKETTPYDSFYNIYEQNEQNALANMVLKLKDFTPTAQATQTQGGNLGDFDTTPTTIPWDADNSTSQKSEVVWGVVSEQASRSIFLKTWIKNIVANSDSIQQCSEDSQNYCYQSPLFGVKVTDQKATVGLKIAEQVTQETAGNIVMFGIGRITQNSGTIVQNMHANKLAIRNFVSSASTLLNTSTQTIRTQIDSRLTAFGRGVSNMFAKKKGAIIKAIVKAQMENTKKVMAAVSGSIIGAATAATVGSAALGFITGGTTFAITGTAAVILTFVTWFFGTFQMILMFVETLLDPMITAILTPGGVCPPGSNRFSSLVPEPARLMMAAVLPLASLVQTLDPYICWTQNGQAKLMTPPKIPPFMSNGALSLTQHAAWVAGNARAQGAPNVAIPSNLTYEYDPLPAGYKWITDPQCDLANSPNSNDIVKHAIEMAGTLSAVPLHTPRGSGSAVPTYIAVQMCREGTVPSSDGFNCIQRSYNTTVKAPVLTGCPVGTTDDGYNCWNGTTIAAGYSGGTVTTTYGTEWSRETGYMRITTSPFLLNGVAQAEGSRPPAIHSLYNARSTCPADLNSTEYELGDTTRLCYAKCDAGYQRDGAVCKSTVATYKREYKYGTISAYYDQPYTPETLRNLEDVKIPYCDFSKPVMLNKMAQFYYDHSIKNPQINADGTITTQVIIAFIGVIASSELSCDVACYINFVTYDPVTGDRFTAEPNGSFEYEGDPDWEKCRWCYRRFYFIRDGSEPQGEFTVTGCTWKPYTAPDGMALSADEQKNFLISLGPNGGIKKETELTPSIENRQALYEVLKSGDYWKQVGIGGMSIALMVVGAGAGAYAATKYAASFALKGLIGQGVLYANSFLGRNGKLIGEIVGGTVGGVGGTFAAEASTKAAGIAPPQPVANSVTPHLICDSSSPPNCTVAVYNNWWIVNYGPIYEQAEGYIPQLIPCKEKIIGADHCTNKYVVRDMVNKYHNENKQRHIKSITAIEPRGKTGCYYSFQEVVYDPATGVENPNLFTKEVILDHTLGDAITCTYESTVFVYNTTENDKNFPVRSYIDPSTTELSLPKVIYPTRNTVYNSDLIARFVRVRPPLVPMNNGSVIGDGFLNLAQFAVFDISGFNVSVQQPTYATSVFSGAASGDTVVNGSYNTAEYLIGVWQQATNNANTEYWEVDLGKNINISEIVYFGGSIKSGRTHGVRIEFLYTNGSTDTPIHTITLPNDDNVQYIPLYSSSYRVPMFPMAGPITIPVPIRPGVTLASKLGCKNKCEDKAIIDSLLYQYNTNTSGSEIIKILQGVTGDDSTCEYLAEVMVEDIPSTGTDGSKTVGKTSVVKQYMSMKVNPSVTPQFQGTVRARFIRIIPSFTPGTVLEFSTIIVWSAKTGENNIRSPDYPVSKTKSVTYYNGLYDLESMTPNPMLQLLTYNNETLDPNNLTALAKSYPNIFQARSNDPQTFFQIDLATPYEIYRIDFIGRNDSLNDNVGVRGAQILLYADRPGDEVNCCNSNYPPLSSYTLKGFSGSLVETVLVAPPPQCTFTLSTTDILAKPVLLQNNILPFSATDTSGGVFSFSKILSDLQKTWNDILPMNATELVTPIQGNVKRSGEIVREILDTVSSSKVIEGTTKKCSDTDVMSAMMTAFNIAKGPKDDEEFGVSKYTMTRILKSAQSTPRTCDVLFEQLFEGYEDYIVDIKDNSLKTKSIEACRFTMNPVSGNAVPDRNNIVDISSNALGLITSVGTITPPFSGPTYAVNCRDPTILRTIKNRFAKTIPTSLYTVYTSYSAVKASFQSTPLSCEYMISRNDRYVYKVDNSSRTTGDVNTYVKAVFTLGADGKTTTLSTVKEYFPGDITYVKNNNDITVYLNKTEEVTLPSIYDYSRAKAPSSRVDNTVTPL